MAWENRKWVIVNVSDITDEMISMAIQDSYDTLRKNVAEDQAILKWEGDTPSCFNGMKTYTHSEIKTELNKPTWTESA